ncbi:MAG TPA: hypothetical protein VFQ61_25635 [Polyangiaceae bacterium]|nr:hypothetical protein [Polyangiaceae bacterium]
MKRTTALGFLGVCLAPWVVACGPQSSENVSAQSLAVTAQANAETTLRGLSNSAGFVAESASLAQALSAVSGSTVCSTSAAVPCPIGSTTCPQPVTTCETEKVEVSDLQDSHDELNDSINSLVRELKEKIFIPANLESETSTAATYLLGPKVLCEETESVAVPGGTDAAPSQTTGLDPDCVEQAQKLAIRLRLSPLGAQGVSVALLLTSAQRNPLTLELEPARAALNLDLGELQGALDALGEDTGSVNRMSGKLQAQIVKNAERNYTLSLSVLQALALDLENDFGEKVAVSLAPSSPTLELGLDGVERKLTARMDYGAFGVRGPLNAFRDRFDDPAPTATGSDVAAPAYTGNIDLSVAGLEGTVTLDGAQDRLKLVGLGLGDAPSTLKFEGTTVLEANLNPNSGRHFDVDVQKVGENASLTFSSFDLSLLMNFSPLAVQIADLPKFMLNDSMRFFLQGDKPALQVEKEQVRVLSGTLNMTSQAQPGASIVVAPGNCLLDSGIDDAPHELLGAFAAGACH